MKILKKEPTQVNKGTGLCEVLNFENIEEIKDELNKTLGDKLVHIEHPSVPGVLIVYSNIPGQQGNFRLSYSGEWIRGTVYFVASKKIDMTDEQIDAVRKSIKRFIITKEYLCAH